MKTNQNTRNSSFIIHHSSLAPPGFTLVELLVATTLSLLILGAVIQVFSKVSDSITDSRAMLEAADRLRLTTTRLQQDLGGITVTMSPPRKPEDNEGYFEYIEGPTGPVMITNGTDTRPLNPAVNSDLPSTVAFPNNSDTAAGDADDILMFTTRSTGRPFVGRVAWKRAPNGDPPDGNDGAPYTWQFSTVESDVAEVAWFVRGRTLYRRVLLVSPQLNQQLDADVRTPGVIDNPPEIGYYARYDVSAHSNGAGYIVPNTLGDLTRRECRYAHTCMAVDTFPFDVRRWIWRYDLPLGYHVVNSTQTFTLIPTLPTLLECSSPHWVVDRMIPRTPTSANGLQSGTVDLWSNDSTKWLPNNAITNAMRIDGGNAAVPADGTRIADDVILTNVIGFDVKAWDPQAIVVSKTVGASVSLLLPGDQGYDVGFNYRNNQTFNGATYNIASYGAYVDMGNPWVTADTRFAGFGNVVGYIPSGPGYATTLLTGVYDTWSTHYESVGTCPQDQLAGGRAGRDTNGFDDPIVETSTAANGIVDDDAEKLASPPYPHPLRGIQVKIRVFEPDSRQIREVTVVQDFLQQ